MRFTNTAYHGPEAVGGTGRTREEVFTAVVLVGVDAHADNLGVILGRGQGGNLPDLLGVTAAYAVVLVLVGALDYTFPRLRPQPPGTSISWARYPPVQEMNIPCPGDDGAALRAAPPRGARP